MANPAFIVEGFQEQKIIQQLCNDCRVVRLEGNGRFLTLGQVAQDVNQKFTRFGNRHFPVFVILDREKRSDSSEEIIRQLKKELTSYQTNVDKTFIFAIPDRKLEAWILPFVDKSGNFVNSPLSGHDGKECEKELKRRLKHRDKTPYKKAKSGVKLFIDLVNPKELAKVSPSFKTLFDNGRMYCRWLHKL